MNLFGSIDLDSIAARVESAGRVEYRDPMLEPYGRPEKNTRSQNVAWSFIREREGRGPLVALIGAKGSGKTHTGGCFAVRMAQLYPGSLGCLISNTYTQAKDNGAPHLVNACARVNLPIEFFSQKKVNGRPFSNVFVIDLDGTGFESGKCSYVLLRSFDAVNKLEGIELDWLWCEEVQDAEKEDFITVWSRVRGQNADNSVFIAGMPRDEFHWMYSLLPKLGMIEEEAFDGSKHKGIMLEPSLMENIKNVGQEYLDRLYAAYDEERARWYIEGKRSSLATNKVLYSYTDHVHRKGRMSKVLCHYDEHLPIVVSFDFNVAPMSVSVWQVKRWNDLWDDPNVVLQDDGTVRIYDDVDALRRHDSRYTVYESLEAWKPADRNVLAQIDEFEVWMGGTEGTCQSILKKYPNHTGGWVILGDATGNRQDTRSSTTDWQIIRRHFARQPNAIIIQGLIQNSNYKTGEVKYSNPDRRDTINIANKLLRNAKGEVSICVLPQSPHASGGLARSIAMAQTKPDGNIDMANDRKDGRDVPRLHFFDTFRYVCWWFNGGMDGISPQEFDDLVSEVPVDLALASQVGGASAFAF